MSDIQKQLTQIRNIIDTLEEATEHFTTLVKNRELHPCTNMLSTIEEGFEAVIVSLNTSDGNLTELMQKLEEYILMIAQQLEQGRFIKIQEILQFSFTPSLRTFKQAFVEVYGESL